MRPRTRAQPSQHCLPGTSYDGNCPPPQHCLRRKAPPPVRTGTPCPTYPTLAGWQRRAGQPEGNQRAVLRGCWPMEPTAHHPAAAPGPLASCSCNTRVLPASQPASPMPTLPPAPGAGDQQEVADGAGEAHGPRAPRLQDARYGGQRYAVLGQQQDPGPGPGRGAREGGRGQRARGGRGGVPNLSSGMQVTHAPAASSWALPAALHVP